MDANTLLERFRDLARPHRVLDKNEDRFVYKATEIAWAYPLLKARDLVAKAQGRPLLYSYGSDGTPVLTKATISSALQSGRKISRRSGHSVEFLLERAFLRTTTPEGRPWATALFKPPTPLDLGKAALNIFSAACRFFFPDASQVGACWNRNRPLLL